MATLNEARAAKERAKAVLADVGEIRGIGIARTEDGFGVKVNLAHESEQYVPPDLDGVPLVVEIVGEIRPFDDTAHASPLVPADENDDESSALVAPAFDVEPSKLFGRRARPGDKHEDD